MYYVYVLRSLRSGKFYKGQTADIDDRLDRHFKGQSIATKSLLPLVLVFVQICESRSEAMILERYLKSGVGREFIKYIVV